MVVIPKEGVLQMHFQFQFLNFFVSVHYSSDMLVSKSC